MSCRVCDARAPKVQKPAQGRGDAATAISTELVRRRVRRIDEARGPEVDLVVAVPVCVLPVRTVDRVAPIGGTEQATRHQPRKAPATRTRRSRASWRCSPRAARRAPSRPTAATSPRSPRGSAARRDTVDDRGARALPRRAARRRASRGSTIARRAAAIRSFFRHLVLLGARTDNPAAELELPRRARRLPRTLSPGEAERLVEAANGTPRATSATARSSSSSTGPGCASARRSGWSGRRRPRRSGSSAASARATRSGSSRSAARRPRRSAATCRAAGPTSTGATGPSSS